MTRESILLILGILVAISPWSGLPLAILSWILLMLGITIAFIGFTLRTRVTKDALAKAQEISSRPS